MSNTSFSHPTEIINCYWFLYVLYTLSVCLGISYLIFFVEKCVKIYLSWTNEKKNAVKCKILKVANKSSN